MGVADDGEGRDTPTPDATTPCSTAENVQTTASDSPKAMLTSAGGGSMGGTTQPGVTPPHPPPSPWGVLRGKVGRVDPLSAFPTQMPPTPTSMVYGGG